VAARSSLPRTYGGELFYYYGNSSTDVVCIRSGTDDRHRCWSYCRCSHHHHRCHHLHRSDDTQETVSLILSFFLCKLYLAVSFSDLCILFTNGTYSANVYVRRLRELLYLRRYNVVKSHYILYLWATCKTRSEPYIHVRRFAGCPRTGGSAQDVHVTSGWLYGPSKQTFSHSTNH